MSKKIDAQTENLRLRQKEINEGGGAQKIADRHKKGLLGARERLAYLFSDGAFQEIGAFVTPGNGKGKTMPADGVVVGTGFINGRQVAAFSQDFTVNAGTLGHMHAMKIVMAQEHGLKMGVPVVAIQDSGGARIQEGVDALSGYGRVFYHNVLLSGVVPQIALILGPCAGGAAYSPALMDFLIMRREHAQLFITGPEIIKSVTGHSYTMAELGSAEMHAQKSGNVHFIAEDDAHALEIAKTLLSYLPSNNTEDPPHHLSDDLELDRIPAIPDLLPENQRAPFDMRDLINLVVDSGTFLEVHASFAQNIVVGFARIGGAVTGIVGNQPMVMAGALDINAADKTARFVRFCNIFNIPLVTLVDVPGFLPGLEQEQGGIIRHGAKMLHAYAACTTPKITVIIRKAFGGSYLAMCSMEMGADVVLAWPSAEIAVMGAEGAVSLLHRKELDALTDPAERATRLAELAEAYRQEFSTPYLSASKGYIHDIIDPAETRAQIAMSLRKLLHKREIRPSKKHGNVPL